MFYQICPILTRSLRCRDRMVAGCITPHVQSVYIATNTRYEFESRSWRGVLDTTLCDKICHLLDRSAVFYGYSGFLRQYN